MNKTFNTLQGVQLNHNAEIFMASATSSSSNGQKKSFSTDPLENLDRELDLVSPQ